MKLLPVTTLGLFSTFLLVPRLHAAEVTEAATWHAQTLAGALGYMMIFAIMGIAAAIVGYKLFDKFTPGDLNTEILQNRNVAAAVVAAAVILGISIIIAACIVG